ncbi:MAG: transcriptional repressor [Ignavibacteria bacterium]|nr:transcriptional repressor [Ignavibacteria bacterium]
MDINITVATDIFTNFLKSGSFRITPERFEILNYALSQKNHFSADELFLIMKNDGSNISRATVYNTLELLNESGLLSKQKFLGKESRYERINGVLDHNHLICLNCGKIIEFKSSEIQNIESEICEKYGFTSLNHTFNIYGHCKDKSNCKSEK